MLSALQFRAIGPASSMRSRSSCSSPCLRVRIAGLAAPLEDIRFRSRLDGLSLAGAVGVRGSCWRGRLRCRLLCRRCGFCCPFSWCASSWCACSCSSRARCGGGDGVSNWYDIPQHEVIHTLVPEARAWHIGGPSATFHRRSIINTLGNSYREDPW
jgi:hypothetical protein